MAVTAVFGGTFNPVHLGHERLLREVLKAVSIDRVIVMPSKIPPHKQAESLASESDRLEMCRLAFSGMDNVSVSDYEFKRQGKSYSVYTVRHLKEIFPDDKLYFIMGSDMLLSFHEWYQYEEILSMCGIICLSRCDKDTGELEAYAETLRDKADVIILNVEPFEISSTEIRRRLKNHEDCSCYLNKNVVQYISDKNLY
ncbi:MAG: nicotinate (nicotinamide) nucleotide adenylyltransferase [Oscillospiraceae bacterium]